MTYISYSIKIMQLIYRNNDSYLVELIEADEKRLKTK